MPTSPDTTEMLTAKQAARVLASNIINGAGTLADVGAALGHTSVQSSHRYTHLYPAHLRKILVTAAKKMPTSRPKKRKAGARKSV